MRRGGLGAPAVRAPSTPAPPPAPPACQGGCPVSHRNFLYAFPERLTPDNWPSYDVADLPPPSTVYGCMDMTVGRPLALGLGLGCWQPGLGSGACEMAAGCSLARCSQALTCQRTSQLAYLHVRVARAPAAPLSPATPRPRPCPPTQMRSPTMWLGIAGGFLMCILLYMGVKGSLIIGIA